MKNYLARGREQEMRQLGKQTCREGRYAGFQLIANDSPEHLRVPPQEFADWKAGWKQVQREAEEAKRQTATIVWIGWLYPGRPREVYGVITGCHPTLEEHAEVTIWAPPDGKVVYIPYFYLETERTMSVRQRWEPPSEILMLSNVTERGPVQRIAE